MFGKKPSLYNDKGIQINDLIRDAHPSGGTEVVEVSSGEGYVEDLIENQMKTLEMVAREPTLKTLASLADKLDGFGLVALADRVDDTLKFFSAECAAEAFIKKMAANKDRDTILYNVKYIKSILEKYNLMFVGYEYLKRLDRAIDVIPGGGKKIFPEDIQNWLNTIVREVSGDQPDWRIVYQNIQNLLDPELLEGSDFQLKEIDLKEKLSDGDFSKYTALAGEIQQIATNNLAKTSQPQSEQPTQPGRAKTENEEVQALIDGAEKIDSKINNINDLAKAIALSNPSAETELNSLFSDPNTLSSLKTFREKVKPGVLSLQNKQNVSSDIVDAWFKALKKYKAVVDDVESRVKSVGGREKIVVPEVDHTQGE